MILSVFSALFSPRSGSALRLAAGALVATGLSPSWAQSAEPPQVVAERGVDRFALLCLAHIGQPEGTASAARQAGLASLPADTLRRHDATQGWSTLAADRHASILLHADGACSLLIESLPLSFAFKAVEGKLGALSAGNHLRNGKIGRDYALRYRNLPTMVSVAGSPGNESGEVLLKTLASDLPGKRAERPVAPPNVAAPSASAATPSIVAAPSPILTPPPVTAPSPSVSAAPPTPFPPVAVAPSSPSPQLAAPAPLSSPPRVEAGSAPAPFPPPGSSGIRNSGSADPITTPPAATSSPVTPGSSPVLAPPAAGTVTNPPSVNSPPTSATSAAATPQVAEASVPNLPLFPAAPATPSLAPDLLPAAPLAAATPTTPVDPDKPIPEASLVALFADSCLATKGSYAALQAKADAQGWRAMLPAAARDGFDFSWLIVPGKGVRLGLFLDSLRQKCCVSAFPADPSLIRQAIDARLGLGAPTSQVSRLKEVYVYPSKNGLTVSADFERTEPTAVFANVCSRPKLP